MANRLAGTDLYRWAVHVAAGDHAEASNGMAIRADGPLPDRAETLGRVFAVAVKKRF